MSDHKSSQLQSASSVPFHFQLMMLSLLSFAAISVFGLAAFADQIWDQFTRDSGCSMSPQQLCSPPAAACRPRNVDAVDLVECLITCLLSESCSGVIFKDKRFCQLSEGYCANTTFRRVSYILLLLHRK